MAVIAGSTVISLKSLMNLKIRVIMFRCMKIRVAVGPMGIPIPMGMEWESDYPCGDPVGMGMGI